MEVDQVTQIIIGASCEVMNVLGAGFLEKVYENALVEELQCQNMHVEQQKELAVQYKNVIAGAYTADLLVEKQVIVELKAVKRLEAVHSAQVINYLKASNYEVGLLINFGNPKIEIKRLFNTLKHRYTGWESVNPKESACPYPVINVVVIQVSASNFSHPRRKKAF